MLPIDVHASVTMWLVETLHSYCSRQLRNCLSVHSFKITSSSLEWVYRVQGFLDAAHHQQTLWIEDSPSRWNYNILGITPTSIRCWTAIDSSSKSHRWYNKSYPYRKYILSCITLLSVWTPVEYLTRYTRKLILGVWVHRYSSCPESQKARHVLSPLNMGVM